MVGEGSGGALAALHPRRDPGPRQVSLDLFWLRDESLEDSANLPDPHVLAEEIADDLRSALEQIESVLGDPQAKGRK